jgi:hypothetical protein
VFGALLFALGGPPSASAQSAAFAPPGQHFSIPMPGAPKEQGSTAGDGLRQWVLDDGNFVYFVNHQTSKNGAPYPESDLTSNLNDFIKGVNATTLNLETIKWASPSGHAKALRFSFRLPNGLFGKGIFVIDGPEGFGAAIVDRRQGSSQSPILDQFPNSLTILP